MTELDGRCDLPPVRAGLTSIAMAEIIGDARARSRRVALDRPAELVSRLALLKFWVLAAVLQKSVLTALAHRGDRRACKPVWLRTGRRAFDHDGSIPGASLDDLGVVRRRRCRPSISLAPGRARSDKFPNRLDRMPPGWVKFDKPHRLWRLALMIEGSRGSEVADDVANAIDLAPMRAKVGEEHPLKACRQIRGGGTVGGRSEEF